MGHSLVPGCEVEVGLRNLHERGALLDSSANFRDRYDEQLEGACQLFRFMDYQTTYTPRQATDRPATSTSSPAPRIDHLLFTPSTATTSTLLAYSSPAPRIDHSSRTP